MKNLTSRAIGYRRGLSAFSLVFQLTLQIFPGFAAFLFAVAHVDSLSLSFFVFRNCVPAFSTRRKALDPFKGQRHEFRRGFPARE